MQCINIHTHSSSENPDVLEIVNQYPGSFIESNGFFSIGIHPWYIDENSFEKELLVI
jgi:TatD DNase family protein